MILQVQKNKTVAELQSAFNQVYPYLRIDFFTGQHFGTARKKLLRPSLLENLGTIREGKLQITDAMTVGELEKIFRDKFKMNVQVARKSGGVWLETTVTDNWTLKQQNDHGRELSAPIIKNVPDENGDIS